MKRLPHKAKIQLGTYLLELIHPDLVGPIPVMGYDGSKYFLYLLDDYTNFSEVYCIKSKADAPECFWNFKKKYEHGLHKICRLRSDNGEFKANTVHEKLFENGIQW
jgi:hypothetical protein